MRRHRGHYDITVMMCAFCMCRIGSIFYPRFALISFGIVVTRSVFTNTLADYSLFRPLSGFDLVAGITSCQQRAQLLLCRRHCKPDGCRLSTVVRRLPISSHLLVCSCEYYRYKVDQQSSSNRSLHMLTGIRV